MLKRLAAQKLQSAFRRKRWRTLISSVGLGVGGCFASLGCQTQRRKFRPLVDANGAVSGVRGPSGRWYVERSLGCLHPLHPIRALLIMLIEAPWFDHLILLVIAINCYVLAVSDRPTDSLLYLSSAIVAQVELYCTVIFTIELGCRAVAMGIFTSQYHSLLSDPWNRLDLLVVSSAWLPLILTSFSGYTALRALRAFRPLRALHMMPGVKRQVDTIFKALPKIGNVCAPCLYALTRSWMLLHALCPYALCSLLSALVCSRLRSSARLLALAHHPSPAPPATPPSPAHTPRHTLCPHTPHRSQVVVLIALVGSAFAILGMQLFMGSMTHRCFLASELPDGGVGLAAGSAAPAGATPISPEGGVCNPHGSSVIAGMCLEGVCLEYGEEPYHGAISFDSFPMAWVLVFMTITGEGWTDVMYTCRRTCLPPRRALRSQPPKEPRRSHQASFALPTLPPLGT